MIDSRQVMKLSFLSIAITMSTQNVVHAAEQSEIEQLRQEVQALRTLVEQQQLKQNETSVKLQQVQHQAVVKTPAAKDKNTSLSFYGNIRMDASYQAEGSSAARLYNNINKVPLRGVNESSDRLKSTLAATRLGMDVQHQLGADKVSGKLEVDFLGGANFDNLRIRHAYINYKNWLVGQTWSNFAVPDYMPETIDALGYVGGAVKRTPQVRYQFGFAPTTALILAAEDPGDASSQMRMPAVTARLNHQLNDDAKFSLRGMVNEKRTSTDDTVAWGAGLGLQYKLQPETTLKADYYHVKGDSSFVSWTNPGFTANAAGQILDENEFDSITVGLTQQFNPQWRGTLGFGYMSADVSDRYKTGSGFMLTDVNKELWQGWVNAFYSPVKPVSLGVEYVYGERKAVAAASNGETKGEDNRVSAVAIYNF